MMAVSFDFGLASIIKQLLQASQTIAESFEKTLASVQRVADRVAARRTAKQLENLSVLYRRLLFDPHGLRALVAEYCEKPGRGTWQNIQSALNRSQELYLEARKRLDKLSERFQARHAELMKELETYFWSKGRILTGIGDRVKAPRSKEELAELKALGPLFDEVNAGITKVQAEIAALLAEQDREQAKKPATPPPSAANKSPRGKASRGKPGKPGHS